MACCWRVGFGIRTGLRWYSSEVRNVPQLSQVLGLLNTAKEHPNHTNIETAFTQTSKYLENQPPPNASTNISKLPVHHSSNPSNKSSKTSTILGLEKCRPAAATPPPSSTSKNISILAKHILNSLPNLSQHEDLLQRYLQICALKGNAQEAYDGVVKYISSAKALGRDSIISSECRQLALEAAVNAHNAPLCAQTIDLTADSPEVLRSKRNAIFMRAGIVGASCVLIAKWSTFALGAAFGVSPSPTIGLGPVSLGIAAYAGITVFWLWMLSAFQHGGEDAHVSWIGGSGMLQRLMREDTRASWDWVVAHWDPTRSDFAEVKALLPRYNLRLAMLEFEGFVIRRGDEQS